LTVLAGAALVLLLIGVHVGFHGRLGTEITTTSVTPSQLAECAGLMHIAFPPSTKAIGFHKQEWQDTHILLKVTVDRKELDQFLTSSPFAGKELRRDQIRISGGIALTWWDDAWDLKEYEWKEGQAAFVSEEADLPGADGLNVLIDLRDPDRAVIYLEFMDP